MRATEDALATLHTKVAEVLTNALKADEPTVGMVAQAIRFLDANKITCAPTESKQMSDLETLLASKNKERVERKRVGNVTHAEFGT